MWHRTGCGLAVHHLPDHHHQLSDDDHDFRDDHHVELDDATASTTTAILEHEHDLNHDDNDATHQQHVAHHHHHTRGNDNNSTAHHHYRPVHQPARHHTRTTRHQMNPTPERIEPLNDSRDSAPCTCFAADGRYWCLLHDPDWPDTTAELLEAMRDAE